MAVVTHAALTSSSPLTFYPCFSLHRHLCCPVQGSQDLTVPCLDSGHRTCLCLLPLLPGLPNPITPAGCPLGFRWWLLRPQCHPALRPGRLFLRCLREAGAGTGPVLGEAVRDPERVSCSGGSARSHWRAAVTCGSGARQLRPGRPGKLGQPGQGGAGEGAPEAPPGRLRGGALREPLPGLLTRREPQPRVSGPLEAPRSLQRERPCGEPGRVSGCGNSEFDDVGWKGLLKVT